MVPEAENASDVLQTPMTPAQPRRRLRKLGRSASGRHPARNLQTPDLGNSQILIESYRNGACRRLCILRGFGKPMRPLTRVISPVVGKAGRIHFRVISPNELLMLQLVFMLDDSLVCIRRKSGVFLPRSRKRLRFMHAIPGG